MQAAESTAHRDLPARPEVVPEALNTASMLLSRRMGHLHTQFAGVGDGAAHARLDRGRGIPFPEAIPSFAILRESPRRQSTGFCAVYYFGDSGTFSHLYGPLLDPYGSYKVTETCYAKRRIPPIRPYRYSAMVPLTHAVPTPITARVICAKDAIFLRRKPLIASAERDIM